ncbi:basic leucine zipper 34-like [Senna tora]|uniref:Basic leucine zipper 34-like n=1 Tax=Senna tora TaxID=362788 RepID=A0A835C8U4_9FABA|nr:basic leucine zipper 34-like [Senna tora]
MEDRKKRDFENFHGGSSRGDGYGGDNKILKIDQFQEGRNFYPNMDPKILRESIAARSSSQRSKQRKPQNVIELEMQIKALQTRIGFLHSQIEANENKKFSLLVEQQAMKLQIVAKEKVRLLKEAQNGEE